MSWVFSILIAIGFLIICSLIISLFVYLEYECDIPITAITFIFVFIIIISLVIHKWLF